MESVGQVMKEFYKGKKVLVTGHTGFKGSWLCKILIEMGAEVIGYALEPITTPSLFNITNLSQRMTSYIGDIRDFDYLYQVFEKEQPEVIFHLAAQPIVLESYQNPKYTYETNVMGTVNLLECVRLISSVKSVINVTTDKVYLNNEWVYGYRENDRLNGYDPYSNSKSCSELVTSSYINSFFKEKSIPVSTCRAGNVIGGGDFADNRIIPDCVRAMQEGKNIEVRNPNSIRPYQHVLEPLYAYMLVAMKQYYDYSLAGNYNIGPDDKDCIDTGTLATLFCESWKDASSWVAIDKNGPHEANFLKLDCSKLKSMFNWKPQIDVSEAINLTVEWAKAYLDNSNYNEVMVKQIHDFFGKDDKTWR